MTKKSSALYRKEHWFAIKLKNQMHKRLSHVKERERINNRNRRKKENYRRWYEKNREKIIKRACLWTQQHRKRNKKGRKEKLKRISLGERTEIENIIDEFLEYAKERYSKIHVEHAVLNLNRFWNYIAQCITNSEEYKNIRYISALDRDFITKYVSFVNHDEINKKTGMSLSTSEKLSRLFPLRTFLRYCERKGYIKIDLCRFVHLPPRENRVPKRALTPDEMKRLLEAPNTNTSFGIRNKALLELSYSGLRINEMLYLKIEDVDLITNSVTIINAKGNKDRVVPMTQECIYWIKRWLTRRKEYIKNEDDPGCLFITKGSKPVCSTNFAVYLRKYAKKAGISLHLSLHDLRRATATHLAENGAPIRQLQALLGHATLKTTTIYINLSDEKIKIEHKRTHPSNRRKLHYGRI